MFETRKKAIEEIFTKQKGEITQLEHRIGNELFEQFCLMGFVRRGVASKNKKTVRTWSITDLGREEYKFFFSDPTQEERELAAFLHIKP
jgi:hypothetical protein